MTDKINLEQAKEIADKVNTLIQSSYTDKTTFVLEDIINLGISGHKAKRVLGEFMRLKIVYKLNDKYYAHPETALRIRKEIEKNERPSI